MCAFISYSRCCFRTNLLLLALEREEIGHASQQFEAHEFLCVFIPHSRCCFHDYLTPSTGKGKDWANITSNLSAQSSLPLNRCCFHDFWHLALEKEKIGQTSPHLKVRQSTVTPQWPAQSSLFSDVSFVPLTFPRSSNTDKTATLRYPWLDFRGSTVQRHRSGVDAETPLPPQTSHTKHRTLTGEGHYLKASFCFSSLPRAAASGTLPTQHLPRPTARLPRWNMQSAVGGGGGRGGILNYHRVGSDQGEFCGVRGSYFQASLERFALCVVSGFRAFFLRSTTCTRGVF